MRNKGKPHILCVIYGTELYGSERGTLQATRSLQEAGFDITIAGSKRRPNGGAVGDAARAQGHNVRLIQFGSHLKKSWVLYNKHYRRSTWTQIKLSHRQFRGVVRECQPSHIMIGSTSVLPYLFCNVFFTRVPIIYRMGDAPELNSILHRPMWKWLIRKSSRIVAISDYMKSYIVQHRGQFMNPNKIQVIRNIAPHRTGPFNQALTSNLQRSKKPLQFIYVGQLTPQKGIELLIQALIKLDDPNIGCWVLGEFMGNKEFDERIQNTLRTSSSRTKIELVGYVSDPRPYYKAADWHIAPSTYEEPLGNVVQEAQLQGTPSIVTNKGGLPELIEHEKTGWLLETPTPEAIIRCIQALQGSPDWVDAAESAIHTKSAEFGNVEFRQAWIQALSTS